MTHTLRHPTRRAAIAAGCASLGGLVVAGCGNKRRGGPPLAMPEPAEEPEAPAPPPPPEPTEGRLVAGLYAAHPEWGHSVRPAEPFATTGRWVVESWGHLWVPDFVTPQRQLEIEAELIATEARYEADRPQGLPTGPPPGCRIVLVLGPFAYSFEGQKADKIAWGVTLRKVYREPDGGFSDVLACGLSFADLRNAWAQVRPDSVLCRFVPGAGHEFAHVYTGRDDHS